MEVAEWGDGVPDPWDGVVLNEGTPGPEAPEAEIAGDVAADVPSAGPRSMLAGADWRSCPEWAALVVLAYALRRLAVWLRERR